MIPFGLSPFDSLPFRIVRDDRLDDSATYLIAPLRLGDSSGDPYVWTGSTRAFGAIIAHRLAAAFRPEGLP